MTTKDLIKFCIRNGVTVSFEPDPCGMGHTGRIKVSDWRNNMHFARTVDLFDLDRMRFDITDYIIDEASFNLRLNNGPVVPVRNDDDKLAYMQDLLDRSRFKGSEEHEET